jgi:membrane protein DedA with SNARE-associated domain
MLNPSSLVEKWGAFAPYIIFALTLLAGLNLPISIDVLITLTALLAANYLPEKVYLLFFLFTTGCIFSAWISYSLGRFFVRFVSPEKTAKIGKFYKKFGVMAFFICRFIPFGVRNAFFMTSGASKVPFRKFALFDSLACTLWATLFFIPIYKLGQNFETILKHLKHLNIILFSLFLLSVGIAFFLYKRKKKKSSKN